MRKLIPTTIAFILLSVAALHICQNNERQSFDAVLKDMLASTSWERYEDPDFHYVVYYPAFFTQEETLGNGVGHVQFAYHANDTNIVMECRVTPHCPMAGCKDSVLAEKPMQHYEGYRSRTHHVVKNKLCYALTLYYPEEYHDSVARLIHLVDTWDVWDRSKPRSMKLALSSKPAHTDSHPL